MDRKPQKTVTERTMAMRIGRKEQLTRMSIEERRALGLRLFAILSGRRSQAAYRARGITDPCAKARAVKAQRAFERKMLQG
jgi:hypothetical protein